MRILRFNESSSSESRDLILTHLSKMSPTYEEVELIVKDLITDLSDDGHYLDYGVSLVLMNGEYEIYFLEDGEISITYIQNPILTSKLIDRIEAGLIKFSITIGASAQGQGDGKSWYKFEISKYAKALISRLESICTIKPEKTIYIGEDGITRNSNDLFPDWFSEITWILTLK